MNAPVDTPTQHTENASRLTSSLTREHGFEPLRVDGRLPEDLNGTLYRVGPGMFESQGKPYSHMFEADGAVCSVRLAGGKAEGAHRVVQSLGLLEERRQEKPLYGSAASWPRRVMNNLRLNGKNAANTNLMMWQDRLFALYELSKPTELSMDLQTLGERDLEGGVPSAFSAHPHRVNAHKAIYNFGVRYGATTYLDLFRLPDRGKAQRIATIPLSGPVMLHDFIATERHLVFFVAPAKLRIGRAMLGLNPMQRMIGWDPEDGTEVIVVPLSNPSAAHRFKVDAFYQWHFAGAFESKGELFVDIVKYPNLDTLYGLADGIETLDGGTLTRVRVDYKNKRLNFDVLDDAPCEFPRIDPRKEGSQHRHIWTAALGELVQLDLETKGRQAFATEAHEYASEPIFVPRDANAAEGDGWVLSLIYDNLVQQSYVAVLDSQKFGDGPVARVWFDHHVPITFHGLWSNQAA